MPRKKKVQQIHDGQTLDREGLARRGAVSRMTELIREERLLEATYPGTVDKAKAAIQGENLAAARAVKAANRSPKAKAQTPAAPEAELATV